MLASVAAPAAADTLAVRPIAPELAASATRGESFAALYTGLQRAAAIQAAPPTGAHFASWDLQDWANEPPPRRVRRGSGEQPAAISERGRELVLLGLAWLGRLAGGR